MTIDEALLYLESDDASIRFFSPQDYEAFVTLKKYAKSQQQPCEDCISREAVVKLLEKEDWADTVQGVLSLPSVTPQPYK